MLHRLSGERYTGPTPMPQPVRSEAALIEWLRAMQAIAAAQAAGI